MHNKFILFSAAHWIILGATVLASTLVIWLVKKFPSSTHGIDWALAILLAANNLATLYFSWDRGDLTLQNGLPLHLCDLSTFTCIIVLLWRNQLLFEISYYWGITGAIQALLTPDITVPLTDPRLYTFFISHSGIIVTVLYLTMGLHIHPTKFSLWKIFGVTQIYTAAILLINHLIHANYGYLCAKPQNPSLLDYLGTWPWYILSMEILALIFFALCYAPFHFSNKK